MRKGFFIICIIHFTFICNGQSERNLELRSYLLEFLDSQKLSLSSEKLDIEEWIEEAIIYSVEPTLIECINFYVRPVTDLNRKLAISREDVQPIAIDKSSVHQNWSKKFTRKSRGLFKKKGRMSNIYTLGDDMFLVGFESQNDIWLDIIYKNDNGKFGSCILNNRFK